MLKTNKTLKLIIIFLSGVFIIAGGLFLFAPRREIYILTDHIGGITLTGRNNEVIFSVTDAISETRYYAPIVASDGNLLFIRCDLGENKKCVAQKFDVYSKLVSTSFEIPHAENIGYSTFYWAPGGEYLVYSGISRAYIHDWKEAKEILDWEDLGHGVGGSSCSEVVFTSDGKYFAFCKSAASLLSIHGKVFIFNRNGKLIHTLVPERNEYKSESILYPKFEGYKLTYSELFDGSPKVFDLNNP